jgi:hypothetical protein
MQIVWFAMAAARQGIGLSLDHGPTMVRVSQRGIARNRKADRFILREPCGMEKSTQERSGKKKSACSPTKSGLVARIDSLGGGILIQLTPGDCALVEAARWPFLCAANA